MLYLIDGYNLMHAVGLVTRAVTAKGFERARGRFLDWLADAAGDRAGHLRVIFDARTAPLPSSEYGHRGVRVNFAYGQTADDRIAELVAGEGRPARLTVVSNDSVVQNDARRRGCRVLACSAFVDWLLEDRPDHTADAPPEPDKPDPTATPDDQAAWLAAFSRPKPR